MDTSALQTEYDCKVKLFEQLKEVAHYELITEIKKKKIDIHSIVPRIKNISSVIDKIQRKGIKDPFTEIRDFVGLRVVCLFLNDIKEISDIIKNTFDVLEEENKIDDARAEIFSYKLPQFKVKLKDISTADFEYQVIKDMPFEIQLRTIAQDAWASISHCLEYKQPYGIPDHRKRDFFALNGLFYVADTHFEMIRKEQWEYFQKIYKSI